jgi:site-specific DNA-methyltransferase (adenine-specific)
LSVTHQTILVYARRPSDRAKVRFDTRSPLWREPFAPTSLSMHFTKRDEMGRLYRERTIGGKAYRYFADEGRRIGSVWTDVPAMHANTPLLSEGTGYPTQKPLRLLERIVVGTTEPGALVADFMCGSGTTLVAAAKQGRAFAGADESPLAIRVTEARLRREGIRFVRG